MVMAVPKSGTGVYSIYMNSMDSKSWEQLLQHGHALLERLENLLPPAPPADPQLPAAVAYQWRSSSGSGQGKGFFQPVANLHQVELDDLLGIERQKEILERNTRQFLAGLPANNALLWGARGTGKSSVIKGLLWRYKDQGLRLVEVDRRQLNQLPAILDSLRGRTERFILYCDDLSFEADDSGYKELKVALDGGLHAGADNVLIYATSNRRHLVPEKMQENLEARIIDEELHHGDTLEEKLSLSDRFGLWLSFYPFNQDSYLEIVSHYVDQMLKDKERQTIDRDTLRHDALNWAGRRASRSGRSAWQFARDWIGQQKLKEQQ